MVRHDALTEYVQRALAAWPLSRRDLAARCGIPNTTLVKIANGQLGASEDVARRLLSALDEWQSEQRLATQLVKSAGNLIRAELRHAKDRKMEKN